MASTSTTLADPKSDADASLGSRIAPGDILADRYEVEELLGSGGMGVVVAARHRTLGHRVAVKFLTAWSDAEGFVRFSREARIIASLESEHVVRVIDYGMHGAMPFMAMELLAGRDLGRELKERGTLPVPEAVDCIIQACDGLAAAHAKGVVHRDVKLANLFLAVRADGERIVKLLDFGVSKVADGDDEVDLTRTSCMIGSPVYMSPEQIRDPRSVDERADIWSLGVVLHRLLTAGTPFEGQTTSALCAAVAADAPTSIRAQAPHLPAELEAVVLRCLEKKPADRHPSVISLASALAPFASDVGRRIATRMIDLAPPGWAFDTPSATGRSASGVNVVLQSVPTSASRRRRVRFAAGVVALASIVVGMAGLRVLRASKTAALPPIQATAPALPASTTEAAAVSLSRDPPSATATSKQAPVANVSALVRPPIHPTPVRHAPSPASASIRQTAPAARPAGPSSPAFGGTALDDHR